MTSVIRPASESRCSSFCTSSSNKGPVRQPVGDALDQLHPVESGEHQLGARLLRHLRDVERDRGVGDDPRDEDPLTFQKPCHVSPNLPVDLWWRLLCPGP